MVNFCYCPASGSQGKNVPCQIYVWELAEVSFTCEGEASSVRHKETIQVLKIKLKCQVLPPNWLKPGRHLLLYKRFSSCFSQSLDVNNDPFSTLPFLGYLLPSLPLWISTLALMSRYLRGDCYISWKSFALSQMFHLP